ncbi:Sodium/hydrogen exchanger family-domain-containing protein [Massariosphaeria phaeospora]|uniref:Sodium/hydrogen exchanger family-domain-containing protein n=1 Tax=Massariosphaeria phaeospora TaxID=100035 RepID=A0A7C8HZQ7_9PLEO|nr:Sodium/hydrogen exchanger family-domain-containing protein [Massariosphaeria phaeospora]
MAASLPYHEPDIVTILVLTSFLLLLNIVNAALDRILYCGLLGQVLLGIAWGTPGSKWLSTHVEEVVVQLGYLGLILLVYEGGLSTSFKSLKANLFLSVGVAITGIAFPIAISYSLQGLLDATPLQAFSAGAALCSTSLGTTFTVLAASGLSSSRLGVVLTSAAMMDDVVGLVMVQVISNLGGGNLSPIIVVRPILISVAFAVVVPLACHFIVKPTTLYLNRYREVRPAARIGQIMRLGQTAFALHTALLVALVTGATYAGTSNLLAAYIAGAVISWWDSEVPHLGSCASSETPNPVEGKAQPKGSVQNADEPLEPEPTPTAGSDQVVTEPSTSDKEASNKTTTGEAVYERYYQQAVSRILQPFFFASIGFSIPVTRMFRASIVWRGLVYAILMTFGKLVCGLWLVRFSSGPGKNTPSKLLSRLKLPSAAHFWGKSTAKLSGENPIDPARSNTASSGGIASPAVTGNTAVTSQAAPSPPKPFSLHPPLILALAMTARGEIGFLISAVAESKGVFSSSSTTGDLSSESDIFLVVTWAIVLCTILGPLGVGLSVRRVRALEEKKNKEQEGTGRDVLGVWGVE